MKLTNKQNLPAPLVAAVEADDYDAGDSDITVTQLISPPRLVALRKIHEDELEEDASERIWALMGKSIHKILEQAEGTMLAERRLYTEVGGWKVSGAYDRMALISGGAFSARLQDYKMASVWEAIHGVKEERKQQLNLLAHLARLNGYTIDGLEVVYIFRDWSKTKALQGGDYPKHQVLRAPVPLWTSDVADEYLRERVMLHQAAQDGFREPPDCTPEDRWHKPDTWAVMKEGRKSALRVLDSDGAAQEWAVLNAGYPDDHKIFISHRPGEDTRCEHYCPVAQFCTQFQESKDG